ncbi:MAG TPA: riboflavin synthase [Gemmatimonadales bacterium]|nr:riboflavin synthase [Gemmatimonadales bacterium]
MFTGIVTAVGRVTRVERASGKETAGNRPPGGEDGTGGIRLTIRAPYRGLRRGESIAVSGVCLTVERVVSGGFTVRVVETTLERTLFGAYRRGRRVNLERALRAGDRLGGHFVQGHVDGVGVVERVERRGDALLCDVRVPPAVRRVAIPLGSIAVDGVSLTINALPGPETVQVSLVPHTVRHTTLGALRAGDAVHLEADVLGKYVQALCRSPA